MSIVLFDNTDRKKLYPLNNCCAVASLRIGILTIKERWEQIINEAVYVHTEHYLSVLYASIPMGQHLWIDAAVLPDKDLVDRLLVLEEGQALADENGLIGGRKNFASDNFSPAGTLQYFETIFEYDAVKRLEYPWHFFQYNDEVLRSDFEMIIAKRQSQPLPLNNQYISPENIFVEEGAQVYASIINASTGPIYIGKNSTILEGVTIRGPFALCEGATVKMGAKIYGATTAGPYCVIGGEIKNVVMQGYSNKAHDGYLGDSVIGNWCNFGAGTSNSNVKNTGGMVKMYSAYAKTEIPVAVKCGVVMGDYSRTSINSSINTGTVVGTCCNVFGEGLLPKYIADFNWGAEGITKYKLDKAIQDIENWKKMKGHSLNDAEIKVLKHIFDQNF